VEIHFRNCDLTEWVGVSIPNTPFQDDATIDIVLQGLAIVENTILDVF
jgi:hypothetical protein